MKRIAVVFMIIMMIGVCVAAEEVPDFDKEAFISMAETKKTLELALVDCVAMALKNNSEINLKRISPRIEEANVMIEKATFEPDLSFDFTMEDNTELTATASLLSKNPSKTRASKFNFGYDQKFMTGTELEVNFYNTRTGSNSPVQSVNPSFDSKAEIVITQPLLKGAGIIVNKADFLIAKNNRLKSTQEFIQEVIRVLTEVKRSYYDFQYSQEQYRSAGDTLKRVQTLRQINMEKHSKGIASNVDLLESEAEAARAEQALLAQEASMKLAEDNLKLITNLVDDPELWNAGIRLLDKLDYREETYGLVDAIRKAFTYRPDYEAAKIDLRSKDISIVFYKNGMLPVVDLTGSYGLNGLAKNYGKDLAHVSGGKYPDWTVGVAVKVPLGNEEEKGRYDKSLLEKKRALISFKRLEQNIILQVRDAVRNIDIKYRVLEAAKKAKEAEERNYEAQETRFRAGLVSTLDVLTYQERLTRSEVEYIKGVIDYNVTLIELAKAQGTTLADDNITIE